MSDFLVHIDKAKREIAAADSLLAVAESVIAAYDEHIRNYSEVRKNWNDQIPGEWPVQLRLTMEDVRKARAAIELAKQPDIDPVTKKPFNKD